jgi:HlyD family secretion protein
MESERSLKSAVGQGLVTARNRTGLRRPRRWLPYAGAMGLVVLVGWGMWPERVPVEVAEVRVGALRATVDEEGETRIRDRFVVSAPLAGELRRIGLQAGAEVTAGETVVAVIEALSPSMLDPRARLLAEAGRDSAIAQLEKARLARTLTSNEWERVRRLYMDGAVSVQDLEWAQLRAEGAVRDLAAAEEILDLLPVHVWAAVSCSSSPSRP